MEADDLVVLRKFSQLHEAELAVSALDAANIDAVLRDASYGGFRPEASIAGGGVSVLVRRGEIHAANEVLDAPVVHEEAADAVTCANCGRQLEGSVCAFCDTDERETYLTPANTRASISKLKLAILVISLAVFFGPTVIDRLSRIDERTFLVATAVVLGALFVVVLFKAFVTSNDERL
jgi:hypothetical protein